MSLSPAAERRSGSERRSGGDRRFRSQGVWLGTATERAARDREPVALGRLLPHARFNETEAAQRIAAIAAHQGELSIRLGRNVGLSVAALDYLLNISGDLVAPTIVEHDILEVLEHRSVTEPICAKAGASDAAINVTVSGGLTELSPAATGASEARLIAAADRALYLAKGRGGNCVIEEVLPCRD